MFPERLAHLFQAGEIDNQNYRFYLANNYVFFLGTLLHFAFIPLFYIINVKVLMYYNVISVFIFLLAYILNRKGKHTLSTVFAFCEIILHAVLAIYLIGWETGFFYYILAIIPLLFYNPSTTKFQKIILAIFVTTIYLSLKYYSNIYVPAIPLTLEVKQNLYFLNSFFLFFIIAALTFYFSLAFEITENRINKARNQADVANQTKSIFLANMSHELRTPLNAIIGYSEMLIEEEEEKEHAKNTDDLTRINNAGNHLLALISNILDLSKIESGKTELEYQDISIKKLINDVVSAISLPLNKEKNTLIINIDDSLDIISVDITKLKQTLINILSNACKFTKDGTITLNTYSRIEQNKSWIYFSVSDTGIGIANDKLTKLFQPFSQVDTSTTRLYGGTGLGLTICKHFITLMGGFIYVKSELGKGTTFTIKLPA